MRGLDPDDPIECRLSSFDQEDTLRYLWDGVMTLDQWLFMVFTFDGVNLLGYFDGVPVVPTSTPQSAPGAVMTDTARAVTIGTGFTGFQPAEFFYHSVGMWNVVLTAAEVAALHNSGNGSAVDWNADTGAYVSSDDLQHWWRLGFDPNTLLGICADYVEGGSAFDLSADAILVTPADIVTDAP